MPKNRLPAIADRAEWEKVTKSRAGTRWDSAVEKGWKDIGGNPEEMLSIKKFGAQDRSKRKDRNEGKVSAKKQGERGGTLINRDKRQVKRRRRNEIVFARQMDYAKTLKLRFRVGDLDVPARRKRYTTSREEKEEHAQMYPCGEQ